jgi:hypothetical protein
MDSRSQPLLILFLIVHCAIGQRSLLPQNMLIFGQDKFQTVAHFERGQFPRMHARTHLLTHSHTHAIVVLALAKRDEPNRAEPTEHPDNRQVVKTTNEPAIPTTSRCLLPNDFRRRVILVINCLTKQFP